MIDCLSVPSTIPVVYESLNSIHRKYMGYYGLDPKSREWAQWSPIYHALDVAAVSFADQIKADHPAWPEFKTGLTSSVLVCNIMGTRSDDDKGMVDNATYVNIPAGRLQLMDLLLGVDLDHRYERCAFFIQRLALVLSDGEGLFTVSTKMEHNDRSPRCNHDVATLKNRIITPEEYEKDRIVYRDYIKCSDWPLVDKIGACYLDMTGLDFAEITIKWKSLREISSNQ